MEDYAPVASTTPTPSAAPPPSTPTCSANGYTAPRDDVEDVNHQLDAVLLAGHGRPPQHQRWHERGGRRRHLLRPHRQALRRLRQAGRLRGGGATSCGEGMVGETQDIAEAPGLKVEM